MNYIEKAKFLIVFMSLLLINGCTYYKAMNVQEQRRAIIEANLVKEYNISKKQVNKKLQLEKKVSLLNSQISNIDNEIKELKYKSRRVKSDNMKLAHSEYIKKLEKLKKRKIELQKNIKENTATLSVM
ncbi:hypothetical protein [Photobacterium leiognathi]|uniref:hypothetical protein n=1 Tax=Photobacterium leiognathi TaxID=553611 RepID=UPI0027366855|nr:hypothetical protein [Photobacterium leiognathi]